MNLSVSWHQMGPDKTMHESSVIQYFTEKAQRELAIEALLDVLEIRFPSNGVQTLKPIIENIEELQQLKLLRREAVQVPSLDEFRRILSSNATEFNRN